MLIHQGFFSDPSPTSTLFSKVSPILLLQRCFISDFVLSGETTAAREALFLRQLGDDENYEKTLQVAVLVCVDYSIGVMRIVSIWIRSTPPNYAEGWNPFHLAKLGVRFNSFVYRMLIVVIRRQSSARCQPARTGHTEANRPAQPRLLPPCS